MTIRSSIGNKNINITASRKWGQYRYEFHIIDKCPARNVEWKKIDRKGNFQIVTGLPLQFEQDSLKSNKVVVSRAPRPTITVKLNGNT